MRVWNAEPLMIDRQRDHGSARQRSQERCTPLAMRSRIRIEIVRPNRAAKLLWKSNLNVENVYPRIDAEDVRPGITRTICDIELDREISGKNAAEDREVVDSGQHSRCSALTMHTRRNDIPSALMFNYLTS